jgi:Flp pilus assembly protein TadG
MIHRTGSIGPIALARRAGRAFARDERGVTLLEFGFLALPFFTIIFAMIETTMVFFAGQILDAAVDDASRLIRTGQAQTEEFDLTDFREQVCDELYGLFDCGAVKLKVSVVTNFTSATAAPPTQTGSDCDPSCDWTIEESYKAGTGKQIVMVQAYYKWPVIVNLPGFNFQNQPDGVRLLGTVRVFANEPF